MSKPDLILLHPPSVYDFRERPILFGPISDLVPSSPVFEMYPVGLTSIVEYLSRQGFSVRIINLALLMLQSPRFNVEERIKSLQANLFGIDLHWLVHVQGGLEIAKLVKKYHPETPVVFGGYSASYFHRELIAYPEVDFVVRGDSTEEPMRQLLQAISSKGSLASIPNLIWKEDGEIKENPLEYLPEDIDNLCLDFTHIIKSVTRFRDLKGFLPFQDWLRYPIMPVLTCRGCTHNCVTCGGSASFYQKFYRRPRPVFRSPERVVEDMWRIQQNIKGPLFVVGDLQQPGGDYFERFLSAAQKRKITNPVIVEFFTPPQEDFFSGLKKVFPRYSVEASVESSDEGVRRAFGRKFSNRALEESIGYALKHGCQRFDLYFMVGLSQQSFQSVLETVSYCRYLYEKFSRDKRLLPLISPLAPFLDPGSEAFENPARHGYRLFCRTLEEHRQALLKPSWKHTLNYETEWMNRDEIVESTYRAALGLNRLKAEYGVVDEKAAREMEGRINQAMAVMEKIDQIVALGEPEKLEEFKSVASRLSISTVQQKEKMKLSTPWFNFRPLGILRTILRNPPKKEFSP